MTSKQFNNISDAFFRYCQAKGYKTGNGLMYPKVAEEYLSWLESNHLFQIENIQTDTVSAYYDYLTTRAGKRGQQALSQITINHHLLGLRLFMDFLWEIKIIDYIVAVPPNQKIKKANGTVLSVDEIHTLFSLCKTKKEQAILALAYGCGLRSQEICELKTDDILFHSGHILVRHGKGNKTREVPMSDTVQHFLRDYMDEKQIQFRFRKQTSSYLLSRPSGISMDNNFMNRLIKKIAQRSDYAFLRNLNFSLHDLRHSIATHLAENGAQMEFIRQFLGHDSIDTSSLYMIRRKRRNRFIAV